MAILYMNKNVTNKNINLTFFNISYIILVFPHFIILNKIILINYFSY